MCYQLVNVLVIGTRLKESGELTDNILKEKLQPDGRKMKNDKHHNEGNLRISHN